MKIIKYYEKGKEKKIMVKICSSLWCKFWGLMFRFKNRKNLLFVFDREKNLSIHSLFCKPFKAVWLDEKMRVAKKETVRKWKFFINGKGKYLLEIPI